MESSGLTSIQWHAEPFMSARSLPVCDPERWQPILGDDLSKGRSLIRHLEANFLRNLQRLRVGHIGTATLVNGRK